MKPKKPKKLNPAIFRKAAERVLTNDGALACISISCVCKWDIETSENHREFFELFKPRGKRRPWVVNWWDYDDRESRVLALLLAAEMCQDES